MPGSRRRRDTEGGVLACGFAAVVVKLRFLVPVAWVAVAVAATVSLPQLGSAAGGPLEDVVPADSEAVRAAGVATARFGAPLATDTVVVQADARGLSPAAQKRQLRAALRTIEGRGPSPRDLRAAVPINNSPGGLLGIDEAATTALTYLIFDSGLGVDGRTALAERYASEELGSEGGNVVGVTGSAPARLAEFETIDDALPVIEAASVLAILVIVGLAFRSLGAPLATLFTGAIAYLLMVRLVPWVGDRLGIVIPADVEPVLVVLLLGLVTDYSVFFLSSVRRRLERGDPRLSAARGSVAETAPLVFTAGLIVAACTAALLAGQLDFFRAFGPGLAITTLISLVVAGTLVPALIALFGPRLFGRRMRARLASGDEVTTTPSDEAAVERVRRDLNLNEAEPDRRDGPLTRARRALGRPLIAIRRARRLGQATRTGSGRVLAARIASARPIAIPIALLTTALLLAAASGLRTTELGVTFIRGLPDDEEVKRAADAAANGFSPGALAPTEIDLVQPGISDRVDELITLETLIAQEPGVAAVIGPREQPPAPSPQVMVSQDGGGSRFAVVLDEDPLGAPAIDRLRSLQERMPALLAEAGLQPPPQVSFGGETALAEDTVDSLLDDLVRVGVVVLFANLLLLVIFLRALVAPLYLLAASVLGLAASLGLTTYFFQGLLGHDELTYYVPFAAAVLLIALGSDYNVFVAGRIWREARWRRLGEAIAVATPSAAKAITVAGLALAASFALLAIIPLDSFREFAFLMVVGVLIDTFIVRSLLVPALTATIGERAWWPGPRVSPISPEEFAERVAGEAKISLGAADRASVAVLTTLGERIGERDRREVADRLPPHLAECLLEAPSTPERFPLSEFLARMRARENGLSVTDTEARARAVMSTLDDIVPGGLDYMRMQLSEDYDELFG
jgi:RND superfamily putative drug exporter